MPSETWVAGVSQHRRGGPRRRIQGFLSGTNGSPQGVMPRPRFALMLFTMASPAFASGRCSAAFVADSRARLTDLVSIVTAIILGALDSGTARAKGREHPRHRRP